MDMSDTVTGKTSMQSVVAMELFREIQDLESELVRVRTEKSDLDEKLRALLINSDLDEFNKVVKSLRSLGFDISDYL